jgi:hypothetical protein
MNSRGRPHNRLRARLQAGLDHRLALLGATKDDHRMGRNHLKGHVGDGINAVLAAAGYNFRLLWRWFERLLRAPLLS